MLAEMIQGRREIELIYDNALIEVQHKINNFTDIVDMDEAVLVMERLGTL